MKNKNNLQELYYKGAKLIEFALENMNNTIVALCENDKKKMEEYTKITISAEKDMDQIHDQIEIRMYSRETLVFSRKDRLYLINQMDEIVDTVEVVVRRASVYFPSPVPPKLVPRLIAISERVNRIGTLLKEVTIAVFTNFDKASTLVPLVEKIRREAKQDDLYYLKNLYEINPEPRDFMYFDRLIHNIMATIDTANTFVDGIRRLIAKYRL